MEIQKVIVFNGIEYKLMGQGKYYLSQSKNNEGRKHAKGLHVAIWEFHNKKTVPKGYQIHHKDFNPYNNDISNLECISIKQHAKIHAKRNFENKEYAQNNRKQLDKAIEEAKKWHKSEEGRKWHSEHGKEVFRNLPTHKLKCKQCGKEFKSKVKRAQFCSEKCGEQWRGKNRRIEYTAKCEICGKEFKGTKYKSSSKERRTCSRACANKLNHKHRK